MFDEPPLPPPADPPAGEVVILGTLPSPPRPVCARYSLDPARPGEVLCEPFPVIEVPAPEGPVVIDLTQLVPPLPAQECTEDQPDPLNPAIIVCTETGPAPRLGPVVGPVDDGFGSAIPRARIKLSENAEAEANLIKQGVGGFDADGAEVKVKIDF